jgi:hypothetical protein
MRLAPAPGRLVILLFRQTVKAIGCRARVLSNNIINIIITTVALTTIVHCCRIITVSLLLLLLLLLLIVLPLLVPAQRPRCRDSSLFSRTKSFQHPLFEGTPATEYMPLHSSTRRSGKRDNKTSWIRSGSWSCGMDRRRLP